MTGDLRYTLQLAEFPDIDYLRDHHDLFNGFRLVIEGTTFLIFERKEGHIGVERIHRAVAETWPIWNSYFPVKPPPITIFETDWGLGGGSIGSFAIALHCRGDYDQASSEYLKSILGWEPASCGIDYVTRAFADFEDPMQAYVTDQVAHELGHIYFLHGITDLKSDADLWFALGLGLVYDRLVWSKLSSRPSPVFEAFDRTWKIKFSNNSEIDQRLINPNTDNDEKFGLIRIQTYGHAKSLAYLTDLRLEIGPEKFDDYVKSYLSRPVGSSIEYKGFLSLFSPSELATVKAVELKYQVR